MHRKLPLEQRQPTQPIAPTRADTPQVRTPGGQYKLTPRQVRTLRAKLPTWGTHPNTDAGIRRFQGHALSLSRIGFPVTMTKERTMRYTIAVTSITTNTGSMTVEAASPEAALERA
jgi:hypothetical protein